MRPWLYSIRGFHYCDLLLADGVWSEVRERGEYALELVLNGSKTLLDIALSKLSLGRAALQEAIANISQETDPSAPGLAPDLTCITSFGRENDTDKGCYIPPLEYAHNWLNEAIIDIRKAGYEDYLLRALLARASWCRWALALRFQKENTRAEQDLQEAVMVAERCSAKLYLIDFHLEAARLSLTVGCPVLESSATEHLAAAKTGIKKTGYNRRIPELEHLYRLLA